MTQQSPHRCVPIATFCTAERDKKNPNIHGDIGCTCSYNSSSIFISYHNTYLMAASISSFSSFFSPCSIPRCTTIASSLSFCCARSTTFSSMVSSVTNRYTCERDGRGRITAGEVQHRERATRERQPVKTTTTTTTTTRQLVDQRAR